MTIIKLFLASTTLMSLISCSTLSPNPTYGANVTKSPTISPSATSNFAKPEFAQADSYFLYRFALRDAKIATAENATIRTDKKGNTTVYTFNNHIIKECGSHLNGEIKVTTNTSHQVQANFPTITQNPMGIQNFTFAIKEDLKDPKIATGIATVNGASFNIEDIILVSGFN